MGEERRNSFVESMDSEIVVAGVDGCRAGWVVVLAQKRNSGTHLLSVKLCKRFEEVLYLSPKPQMIVADIPIGLLETPEPGGRKCDQEARRLLGPRKTSVFSPPARNQEKTTIGLSKQSIGIRPKIFEVDRLMTPVLQATVLESHPELAFRALTDEPMKFNKKTNQGKDERLRAVGKVFPGITQDWQNGLRAFSRRQIAPDDLLDAYVLAWTALRIVEKKAQRVPADPPIDSNGLRMEIWY